MLHGVAGESAEIVEREGVGLVFERENTEALCDSLLRLKRDRALYARLKTQGLKAAPCYDRTIRAREMLAILERVAANQDMCKK